jgi:hypothetical protein
MKNLERSHNLSYGRVTSGTSTTSTETAGATNYTPNGNSASGYALGTASGRK